MTSQEKRLLIIFFVILLGYGVPVELLPRAKAYYTHYQQDIQRLHREINFYRQYKKDEWQEQYKQSLQTRDEFKKRLIQVQDNNPELLGITMQGLLKVLARNTGVNVATTEVPELVSTNTQEKWTLVTQSLEFSANSGSLEHFLHAINNAREYLAVVKLEVRVSNNLLRGTIKVTGFSNIPPPDKIVE